MLGESPGIKKLRDRLSQVARTNLPVVILGETGTGKEVAARYVHAQSGRTGQFIAVDCAALSPSLIESELFGHERGAFTGATQRREGLIGSANNGTLFLDEIGELPAAAQTRLLRILQEGTFRLVGGNEERKVDLRVVAATWRDLSALVTEGRFRRDLYHRLAVVEVRLPPLRERGADIDLLFDLFLGEATGGRAPTVDPSVRAWLRDWPWQGNIRELRNVAAYVGALARGRVTLDDLPPQLRRMPSGPDPRAVGDVAPVRTDLSYMEARRLWLDAFQARYVESMLDQHDGNVSAAARAAGMDRRSIQRIASRLRKTARDQEG